MTSRSGYDRGWMHVGRRGNTGTSRHLIHVHPNIPPPGSSSLPAAMQTILKFEKVTTTVSLTSVPVATAPPPPVPPAPAPSRTSMEMSEVTPAIARRTLQRLLDGYIDPMSKSGYPGAIRNEAGCILVQKAPNRAVSLAQRLIYRTRKPSDTTCTGKRLYSNCTPCRPGHGTKAETQARAAERPPPCCDRTQGPRGYCTAVCWGASLSSLPPANMY